MHSIHSYSLGGPQRYSAKKTVKPVSFMYFAPEAHSVHLVGDFNDWDGQAHPMKRQVDGAWRAEISLSHGHHHYLFLVDGRPTLDPRAQGTARNELNEKVSLLSVS